MLLRQAGSAALAARGQSCCRHCLGLRYRCEGGAGGKEARIARLRERLSSPSPARLHPRPVVILIVVCGWRRRCGGRSLLSGWGVYGDRRLGGWARASDEVGFARSVASGSGELSGLDFARVAIALVKPHANVRAAARSSMFRRGICAS